MADFIVSLAIQKVEDFLCDEVGLLQGMREDVEWLREELEWIQSFIKDTEAHQGGDSRVQKWISDINDIAFETVDVLETFNLSLEVEGGGKAPKFGIIDHLKAWANIPNKKMNHYYASKEIKSLREKLQEISRRRNHGISIIDDGGQGTSAAVSSKRLSKSLLRVSSYVHEDDLIVGFEDDANRLLNELLKEEPQRCIVSIYGMAGLGKTTLAKKIYNSHQVRGKFNLQSWVCVSQDYKIQDLLRSIIKPFKTTSTREEFEMVEKMNEEDLQHHLHKFLEGRRYLLVLDDVWDTNVWKNLRRYLPCSSNGSRVIITTRNKRVATAADDRTYVHRLQFLNPEESWVLFCKKAFSGDGEFSCFSPSKEQLGREMVGKCAGLPLAILVLGGLLLHKEQLEDWFKVKEHIWRYLRNDSIEISQLLSLSYNDLSYQMKPCFLYLGLFPEDHPMDAEKLMFMWIAEEFIQQEEGTLEDVAEGYLNELISRSLIQVTEQLGRRITECKVHDLLRDLAVQQARETNFFDIYDPRRYSAPLLRCRRHAVHSNILNYFSQSHHSNNSRLRSLVFFNPDQECIETMHLKFFSTNLKLLRVLGWGGVSFPLHSQPLDMIGELIHLKFLCLSNTNILKLPPSIGKLRCLQFLEVLGGFTCTLPDEICKLTQLRHIRADLTGHLRVETLTNLRTLRCVDYEQWLEINTVKLINLRSLWIKKVSKPKNATYSLESVTKLKSLQELSLVSSPNQELPPLQPLSSLRGLFELWLGGGIQKLPRINEFPQGLEMLTLQGSKLEEDPMPTLEGLPNLARLSLRQESYKGKQMVCSAGGFRQLKHLELHDLAELEVWQVKEGAMPFIRTLKIYNCLKLKTLPDKLKSVIIS